MNPLHHAPRIHPLVATAAVSVTLASTLGIAALTGVLPWSSAASSPAPVEHAQALTEQETLVPAAPKKLAKQAQAASVPRAAPTASAKTAAPQSAAVPTAAAQGGTASPAPVAAAPQAQAPAAPKNSPVAIGVGAVVGGLLGSQIGSGDGRTLATIAGAVGGGYLGNEIAKKNP